MNDTAQLTYSPERHAILSPSGSFRLTPMTCSLGAELFDVNLGDVSRDDACSPNSGNCCSSTRFCSSATRT